jgi:putative transposase
MRRLHCEAASWHVFARGTRRLLLFRDTEDYATFLRCLTFALRLSGCELWAYALMSNHFHLALYGTSSQLTTCMYSVNRIYARFHNKKYALGGHVFDGPYRAFRVASFRLTLWTLAYVFLNPVKAGLCDKPEDYAWSGYRSFVGLDGSPLEVQSSSIIGRVDLPGPRAWERFYDCLRLEQQRPPKPTFDRPSMAEVHRSQFEWLLEHARNHADLLSGEDPLEVALFWGRQCGIAPRVMANALGKSDSGEIRRVLHQFSNWLAKDPALSHLVTIP